MLIPLVVFPEALEPRQGLTAPWFLYSLRDHYEPGRERRERPTIFRLRRSVRGQWLGRVRPLRVLAEKLPFLALASASAMVTLKVQRAGGAFRALHRLPLTIKLLVAGQRVDSGSGSV